MAEIDNNQIRLERRKKPLYVLKEYLVIFLMLAPFAAMVNWIFVPLNIVGGGLTGLCSIIYYATADAFPTLFPEYGGAIPIWLTTFAINAVLLIVASLTVGWRFCARTAFGAMGLAFWYKVIPIRMVSLIEEPLLGSIVGGLLFGCVLAVIFLQNGSTGGTDIIAMIVTKYRNISLGRVMVACDILIILATWLLPVPAGMQVESVVDYKLQRIFCGLIMAMCYTFAIDWFINRVTQAVTILVISPQYEVIAEAVNQTVNRGVTVIDCHGWYSKQPMHSLMIMARKSEAKMVMEIIFSIDENAFVTEANVNKVVGRGFDLYKKA